MRAFLCTALSDDLSGTGLAEVAHARPGPEEVRLAIRAAALNFPDLLMTKGLYQHRPALPFVPGIEAAGVVLEVGERVLDLAPGAPVIASMTTGGLAEEAVVPRGAVRPLPRRLGFAEGAALTAAYATALVALDRRGRLRPGEWALIHGAAGGVGHAALDVARLLGARVLATASSAEKRAFLAARGAEHVLKSVPPFREEVKALTAGRGADVIYDPVGGAVFRESMRCIAFDGRLLVVGFASGEIAEFPANLPLIKGFSVVGVRAGEYARRHPEDGRALRAQIDAWADEGAIRPHIHATLPLEKAADGLRMLADRSVIGKVVITP